MMKTVTAKDLRFRTSRVLEEVKTGQEVLVTLRGKPAAILKPVQQEKRRTFLRIGFGLWEARQDMEDVAGWVDEKRRARGEKD